MWLCLGFVCLRVGVGMGMGMGMCGCVCVCVCLCVYVCVTYAAAQGILNIAGTTLDFRVTAE